MFKNHFVCLFVIKIFLYINRYESYYIVNNIYRDRIETDVGAVYHQLTDTYHSSPSEGESDTNDLDRPGPSNRKVAFDWKVACERLLREMWDRSDSFPFRQPVDITEHPDYLKVV